MGAAMANVKYYVLDEEMEPVAMGVAGELFLGGEGEGRGYLNMPDLTAERFVPNPYSEEPGWRAIRGDGRSALSEPRIS